MGKMKEYYMSIHPEVFYPPVYSEEQQESDSIAESDFLFRNQLDSEENLRRLPAQKC